MFGKALGGPGQPARAAFGNVPRTGPIWFFWVCLIAMITTACTSGPAARDATAATTAGTAPTVSSARSSPTAVSTGPLSLQTTARSVSGADSTSGTAATLRIGVVSPSNTDPFAMAVKQSISAQADKAGVNVIECDSGSDTAVALECARQLATQHVDGWVVIAPNQAAPAICDAGPKNIPLTVVGSSAVACATTVMDVDDHRAGLQVGQALGQLAQTEGACGTDKFLIVTDTAGNAASTARAEGIRAGIVGVCPTSEPDQIDAASTSGPDGALAAALADDAAGSVFAAAVDDGTALTVLAALPESGNQRIRLAAIGLDQRAQCQIVSNPAWYGDAALYPDRYGDKLFPPLLAAISGQSAPPTIEVPSSFVTRTDLSTSSPNPTCATQ